MPESGGLPTIPEEARPPKQWTLDELTATDEESARFDQMVELATIIHSITREVGVDLSGMTVERLINAVMREWLPGVEAAGLERLANRLPGELGVLLVDGGEPQDVENMPTYDEGVDDMQAALRRRAAELRGGETT